MPQPAKPGKRAGPARRDRLKLEGRAAMGVHDLAAEREVARINIGRESGVGGPYVLRSNEKPFGRTASQSCDGTQRRINEAPQCRPCPESKEAQQVRAVFECAAGQAFTPYRHRPAVLCRTAIRIPHPGSFAPGPRWG